MGEEEKVGNGGGPQFPDIWLTWVATDDLDMKLRVIATWLLFLSIGIPIILCFFLRIYVAPADQLLRGLLFIALLGYSSFRTLRVFMKVGAALLGAAVLVVAIDCTVILYSMGIVGNGTHQ